MTGQHVRQSKDLSGQYPILTGHCPLTGRYLQRCSVLRTEPSDDTLMSLRKEPSVFHGQGTCNWSGKSARHAVRFIAMRGRRTKGRERGKLKLVRKV